MRLFTKLVPALALFGSAAASISGCSDSGAGHVEQNRFQAEIVHALCDSVQQCCQAAERGFDPVNCQRTVVQQFVVPLSDTSLLYDSAQAGRCVQAVTAAAQACQSVDVTTCYNAFVGNIPPGGACQSSFECASGPDGFAVCDNASGICVQPKRGGLGEPCAYSCTDVPGGTAQCRSPFYGAAVAPACHTADGLICAPGPMGGTAAVCQPLVADCKQNPAISCPQGQACNMMTGACYTPVPLGGSCAAGLCGPDGYCAAGVCTPVKPNATVCAQDAECASGKCTKGLCVVFSKAAADWCGESTVL
jgi:hypothetical protein